MTEVFEDQGHPGNVVSFDGSFLRLDDYSRRTVLVERSDNGADWTEAVTVGIPRDARVQDLQANSTGLVAIVEVPREVDFVDPFEVMAQLGLIDEDQLNNLCQSPFQGVGQPIVVSVCDFEALYEAEQAFWEAIDIEDIDEEELRRLEDEFFALQDMLLQGEEVLRLEPGDAGFDEVADAFLAERAFFEMPYDRLVATSTDGTNWVTNGVADIELDEGDFQYVAGLAISDGRAVVLVAVEPGYFDPATLLFENGLINEDQLINTCDVSFDGEGSPIVVTVCDLEALYEAQDAFWEAIDVPDIDPDELARLSEEFDALEEMLLQGEEVLRLNPGDALYSELASGFLARPRTVVLAGAIGSEFQTVELALSLIHI